MPFSVQLPRYDLHTRTEPEQPRRRRRWSWPVVFLGVGVTIAAVGASGVLRAAAEPEWLEQEYALNTHYARCMADAGWEIVETTPFMTGPRPRDEHGMVPIGERPPTRQAAYEGVQPAWIPYSTASDACWAGATTAVG
ncbi:hypothetical protein [Xylanimonas protaetiae]|uniref:Uncharacterized protein n=1 Tax=Xylanimonas protaetiae TaxID=2509457 RepID=A0A4P6FF63_9MICO|nr:hypothetical protein [Xylanimonas protaetiae]QAY69248.1 hypothetical protein ET471_03670 [Xylanimonas protaetiae]